MLENFSQESIVVVILQCRIVFLYSLEDDCKTQKTVNTGFKTFKIVFK